MSDERVNNLETLLISVLQRVSSIEATLEAQHKGRNAVYAVLGALLSGFVVWVLNLFTIHRN